MEVMLAIGLGIVTACGIGFIVSTVASYQLSQTLGLFGGRRLDDRLWPRRDIRNLSGATLSGTPTAAGRRGIPSAASICTVKLPRFATRLAYHSKAAGKP